ncbi:metallophosphatase [Frigoribacterium sp. Leaf263]|uniref:metallophosphoesterase n=1 Tax=Frigoribacterium sp. Leaf263 TaxID=1736313 RepID=UPI0006FAB250|nr:metallophosphoesterase [Frigoribacterium sp. Leaf263]KQO84578.1 metallophosphatase [Frigoribacterium sp. Leaf263]
MQPLAPGALRLVHLSDAHLTGDATLHQGVVDTTAALDRVLAEAARVEGVRLLVGSGDLSDDGSTASYRLLRSRLGAWAGARRAAVALVPGNHDRREGFAEVFGGDPEGPLDRLVEVDGWRIVGLDTSVPGAGYGDLRPAQLEMLRELLATPAVRGTVLVLHHPPLPAPTVLHRALALRAPEALAEVIDGTDVRVVLAGHYHHHIVGGLAGVPVVVAPGVANDTDVSAEEGTERAVRGSGFVVVDVSADARGADGVRTTVVRAHDAHDGDEVFSLDRDTVARIAAEAGPPAA